MEMNFVRVSDLKAFKLTGDTQAIFRIEDDASKRVWGSNKRRVVIIDEEGSVWWGTKHGNTYQTVVGALGLIHAPGVLLPGLLGEHVDPDDLLGRSNDPFCAPLP